MTFRTLILRSLRFYWRSHVGVVLGAAVGSAALIGALIVGDSVRGSLRERALERLGWVDAALAPADRFFEQTLGQSVMSAFMRLSTALQLPATVGRQDGTSRANRVSVFGVQSNFWGESEGSELSRITAGQIVINKALANHLRATRGDELVVRLHKPSTLSRDLPISPQSDASVALRLRIYAIADRATMSGFDLRSRSISSLNAFMPLADLASAAGLSNKANLWIVGAPRPGEWNSTASARSELFSSTYDDVLGRQLTLPNLDLILRPAASSNGLELRSSRIFLDPCVVSAARRLDTPHVLLTYLVNQFRAATNTVPYSMVTAAGPPYTPDNLREDEIVVNDWLARELSVKLGDSIDLAYFRADGGSQLVEQTNRFKVQSIVPLGGLYADRTLMPEFPGLAKAESTHDWDAGFPLVHKIRDQDEKYWKDHRGTPKAFISLAAGRKLWANRFGDATAIRWKVPTNSTPEAFRAAVESNLLARINPAELGLRFEPVRAQALAGAAQSQDFGGLFIGFSLFLIAAALILMALLFQFGVEQRSEETGTLLALGFTPKQVRRLLLGEGGALAALGGALGAFGGMAYARAMLAGLNTIWRDAVGASGLRYHASIETLVIGFLAAVIVSAITIWLVTRKQARRTARELLTGETAEAQSSKFKVQSWTRVVGCCAVVGAVALVAWAWAKGETANAGAFFGAGALGLIGGLGLLASWLRAQSQIANRKSQIDPLTLAKLALRGLARRRSRSVATAALLASAVFLIVSIGVFRLDANRDATKRSSGTGGFALIGQTTLPVIKDLNTREGREFFGLDAKALDGVRFVPFRVRDGDDASCLNLNRAQRPRVLGVRPELLAERGAFAFARVADGVPKEQPWPALKRGEFYPKYDKPLATNEVAAIGDAASIQWALGKKIGDSIPMTDERGGEFQLKLIGGVANSILQGNLIIDEAEFVRRFPGESGYRMFLIDAPSNRVSEVSATLSRALQDVGLELTPAPRRLAQFNAVQNTYLNTFQVLGGLGLLLGSAGLGVVVLRNVLERRAEFGLLRAVGFTRRALYRLVLGEHAGLLWLGLGLGVIAAAVAVGPVARAPGAEFPWASLGLTLLGVLACGLFSTWLATRFALRGELLKALRNE